MPTGVAVLDEERPRVVDRLLAHVQNRSTDMADGICARSADTYTSSRFADADRGVFASVPVIAMHSSELPRPGDFRTVRLPNNDALVVRQHGGGVRAFVNSCRHRGAPVAEEDSGHARIFSCRYHGWSYDLDGALRSVAEEGSFGDVDKPCNGLVELPSEVRHGFVWVTDSPSPGPSAADWLGPDLEGLLGRYRLEEAVCYRTGTFEEPVNWKVLVDAFVDAYHIRYLHRSSVGPHFYGNSIVVDEIGPHLRTVTPRKSLERLAEDLSEESFGAHVTVGHFLFPNAKLLRQPDHFQLFTFFPDRTEAGRSRMEIRLLVPAGSETEQADRWEKNWRILMDVIRDEDMAMCRLVQRSLSGRNAPPVVFGRNELPNQWFHEKLEDHYLQSAPPG